jgi:membrane protease YdiL (CAAX protease family)
MRTKAVIKQHPVVAYFALAFTITWSGILAIVAAKGFQPAALQMADALLMFLAMVAGPSIAGVTLTAIVDGRAGLRALLSRIGLWRVGLRWYGAALCTIPVLLLAILLPLALLVSPVYAPGFQAIGVAVGLLAGFFEELGWTGYALPRMRIGRSPLAAGLLLGVIWALWHAMADYWGNIGAFGGWWLPHFLLFWIVPLTAYRVLMAWVYEHTRSVLIAQLMHAGYTGSLVMLSPATSLPESILWKAIFAAGLWALVAVVALAYGIELGRQRVRVKVV